jgi:hypothetical protein
MGNTTKGSNKVDRLKSFKPQENCLDLHLCDDYSSISTHTMKMIYTLYSGWNAMNIKEYFIYSNKWSTHYVFWWNVAIK